MYSEMPKCKYTKVYIYEKYMYICRTPKEHPVSDNVSVFICVYSPVSFTPLS